LRRLFGLLSVLLFVIGTASLALTLYLWIGDWPKEAKHVVDHMRSAQENLGKPPEPLLQNPRGRLHESLNGTWQAVIDPYDRGALGGIAPRAAEPTSPSDLAEFSFENGLTLNVPGDWNTQDPRLVFYTGVVWYKRTFAYEHRSEDRTFLYFGAANYKASVYLNGLLIGEHEGGHTPFNFDVTDQLKEGENLLVVRIDSERSAQDIPTPLTDWQNYGGLTRDVLLVHVPETHVSAYELRLDDEPGDRIVGFVEVAGSGEPAQVSVMIPELELEYSTIVRTGERAVLDLPASPRRWSPEDPHLYAVTIAIKGQKIRDQVGFRTIATSEGEILLNGQSLYLRGISIHDETLDSGGRSNSSDQAIATLELAKELGCNFVRLSHYPHPEALARTADRLGLLVWAELPVYWNVAFSNPNTLELARRMFSELIERDRNRASIILWSLGNETPAGPERDQFFAALAQHVRNEDPSRLLSAALLTGGEALGPFIARYYLPALLGWSPSEWIFRIDDGLEEIVDVPAINQYFGWYYSGGLALVTPFTARYARQTMLDNMDRIRFVTEGGKPLIVSELGAGAKAGLHQEPGEMKIFSEEYQAEVYRRQIAMLEGQDAVRGMSPWILKDFRAPLRLYQGVQDYWNRKGLVSENGKKKLAFSVLQKHYHALAARDLSPPG
jgi:beta-glucuronidase